MAQAGFEPASPWTGCPFRVPQHMLTQSCLHCVLCRVFFFFLNESHSLVLSSSLFTLSQISQIILTRRGCFLFMLSNNTALFSSRVGYFQVKYTKVFLRDTTLISPFPMLLFGGDITVQHRERLVSVDGWIHFQVCESYLPIIKGITKHAFTNSQSG